MKRNKDSLVNKVMRIYVVFILVGIALFLICSLRIYFIINAHKAHQEYVESFEYGEEFSNRRLNMQNRLLEESIEEETYENFERLYNDVCTKANQSDQEFKVALQNFNDYVSEVIGKRWNIEFKTDFNKKGFNDAQNFWNIYSRTNLLCLYGSISTEEFNEIQKKAHEARENITHQKVREFCTYAESFL